MTEHKMCKIESNEFFNKPPSLLPSFQPDLWMQNLLAYAHLNTARCWTEAINQASVELSALVLWSFHHQV